MKRIFFSVVVLLAAGCDDDNPRQDPPKDAGPPGPVDASCFMNPQTHYEIINACTDADKIYKSSKPPLLNADGTLPPLP